MKTIEKKLDSKSTAEKRLVAYTHENRRLVAEFITELKKLIEEERYGSFKNRVELELSLRMLEMKTKENPVFAYNLCVHSD